jgi:hypothetical protein
MKPTDFRTMTQLLRTPVKQEVLARLTQLPDADPLFASILFSMGFKGTRTSKLRYYMFCIASLVGGIASLVLSFLV